MTGLRFIEAKISSFQEHPNPLLFSRYKDPSSALSDLFDPTYWANGATKLVSDSVINSTVRVSSAIFTTAYDITRGVVTLDKEHIKDGIITIPKAICHLVVDAAIIGVVATVITFVASLFLLWLAAVVVTLPVKLACQAIIVGATTVFRAGEKVYSS